MSAANKIQISGRVGDTIVLIAGDTPAEFGMNLAGMVPEEMIDGILELFGHALDPTTKAQAVVTQGFAQAAPQQAAQAPAQAAPAPANGAEATETDKFGREYTYGKDGAPACPHGQRVFMKATSQAGKPYKAWVCPTTTPAAYRNKIPKDTNCAMEFARG